MIPGYVPVPGAPGCNADDGYSIIPLMFGMGIWELLIVLIIVLVLFGRKLPEVGEGLGKAIRGFRKSIKEQDEIDVTPEGKRDDNEQSKKRS